MAVLVTTRIPGLPAERYDEVASQLAEPLQRAPGFVAHTAAIDAAGGVVTELWETRDDWQRFFDAHVRSNLPETLPPPESVEIRNTILSRRSGDDGLPVNEGVATTARTSSWTGSEEALERWAEQAEKHVKPFVAGLPGNVGCVFLIDRESGTALTLTLWATVDAAAETDKNAEQSRASTVEATGVELVERGRWQVIA